jgi:hypothetical protein
MRTDRYDTSPLRDCLTNFVQRACKMINMRRSTRTYSYTAEVALLLFVSCWSVLGPKSDPFMA